MQVSLTAKEMGERVRAEREARGRSQSWVAERVGVRRQTIADLEAGRNVTFNVLMGAVAALGKGLAIMDARVDLEKLDEIFGDDADES